MYKKLLEFLYQSFKKDINVLNIFNCSYLPNETNDTAKMNIFIC